MSDYECTCGGMLGGILEVLDHYSDDGCDGHPTVESLSRRERSTLLYIEARVVDHGGGLEPERMNHDDHQNIKLFHAAYLLSVDDVDQQVGTFTDRAWTLAHKCRRERAENHD